MRAVELIGTNQTCGLAYIYFETSLEVRFILGLASRSEVVILFSPRLTAFLPVAIEELSHPFPFRTRKLRAPSPRVVRDSPVRE